VIVNTKTQKAALDEAVFAEQVALLFDERFDLAANVFVASAVAAILGRLFPPWIWMSWLASLWLVILGRAAMPYRRLVANPGAGSARNAARLYLVAKFVTACLWGLTSSVVLVTPNALDHVFIVFVLAGMVAGGIVRNAAFRPAMVAFIVPTVLPVIVILLTRPNTGAVDLGVIVAIFAMVIGGSGLNINRTIVENLRSRVEQELLVEKLSASEASMAEAQRLAHVGGFEFDGKSGEIVPTAEVFRIMGVDRSTFAVSLESLLERVHLNDRSTVRETLATFLRTAEPRSLEYRIVRDDGEVRFVESSGRNIAGPPGQPSRLFVSIQDITERKNAANELAYRDRLLDAVTAGTASLLQAESIEIGMPEALRIVGESMHLDLIEVVQEAPELPSSPALRYAWEARVVSRHLDSASLRDPSSPAGGTSAVRALLSDGEIVIGQRATGGGLLDAMLERLQAQSLLMVPIVVNAKLWGSLCANVSREARDWSANEINTLKTFASIFGSLALRDEQRLSLETSEERFRVLTTTAQDAIVMMDGAGRIRQWNLSAERILGYTADEVVGREIHEFMVPVRFKEQAALGLATFLSSGEGNAVGKTLELAALRKNGTEVAVEVSLAGARIGNGWEAIGILRDVSVRKESEGKLEFANMLLKTELEASPDGILVVDGDRKILSCNQLFLDMWGLDGDAIHRYDGHALATASTIIKDPDRFVERVEFLYSHPAEKGTDEIEFLDGRFIDRRTAALTSPDGAYLGRVWYFRDISKRKRAEMRAIEMASFDALTGLTNRSVFVGALGQAILKAYRVKKTFAVIYLDLDHFQDINDTLGHPVGDGLLRAVANRLRSNMRPGDTLARFGGDEFAVLVADLEDPAVAGFVAEKLLATLAVPFDVEGHEIRTGASIGIDVHGPDSTQPETLLTHADVALYRAKSEARGGYRFFTDSMDEAVRTRVTLGAELRSAVARGQLYLLYQPQVAVGTGRIIGVEALVRWQHPERGTLGPDVFIPVAERTGIIVALGRWALHAACRQARSWLDAGIAPVRVAVNVSVLQFKAPLELEADVTAALADARLPPELLEIELTETALMDVTPEHGEALGRLRASGVTLAIDDFGTGYSSLGYLGLFPVDRIKIAREFVKDIATEPGQAAVAKATIGLARDLGIAVIAEGVETREQLKVLKSLGCPEVQGFFFSKPLDAEEIALALRSGGTLPQRAVPVTSANGAY